MKYALFTLPLLTVAATGHAQQPSAWTYSLGAATMVGTAYDGSDEAKVRVIPALSVNGPVGESGTFNLNGPAATYHFQASPALSVGARAEYDFGRDSSDDDTLAGMDDIDGSLRVGPEVIYQLSPALDLNARVMTDALESDNGTTARVGSTFKMPLSQRTVMSASTGITWASEDYMDTFHGVPGANAAPGRPAYNPSAGFQSVDAGVSVRHMLTTSLAVQANAGADFLLGDAADSPLTERSVAPKAMVGLLFRF